MMKITQDWDGFLQAYASANSGESSGDSKNIDKLSVEKRNIESASFGHPQRSSHVRFNSLAGISTKYGNQNKLKFKSGKIAKNDYKDLRTPMNNLSHNSANFGNNSAPYYHPNLVKSHSHYQKQSDDSKEYSEELGIINYSYENLKAAQGLENNNLLESHNTSEEKFEDMAPLSSLMFPNRICNSIILIIYSCYWRDQGFSRWEQRSRGEDQVQL
jgi:hypothetical protein